MNLDVIAVVLAVAVTAWIFEFVWGVIRGPSRGRWWTVARFAGALVAALVVVGAGTWWLMDSRTVQLMGDHVSRVETSRKAVALTFDDGPNDQYGNEIVADLQRYGARGTFYVIGAEASAHDGALRTLIAAGEEIGNHSYDHRRLVFVSTGTAGKQVSATDAVIRAAGYQGPITFRPPYGKKLLSLPYDLWDHGRTTVMWDLEPDSRPDISGNAVAMKAYVMENVRPGSIIELHPWAEGNTATRQALPMILAGLRAKGYTFATVSGLMVE